MDFAQRQRKPTKHIVGMAFVILLHAGIIWALLHGLARQTVRVIQQPIEATIIEEVAPPPDIPPLRPPPKRITRPPAFIAPPEVPIEPPARQQNTVTAVDTMAPAEASAPIAAPVIESPPAARPAASLGVACPNVKAIAGQISFPGKAQRDGIKSGAVLVEFIVGPNGEIKRPAIVKSTHRVFNAAAMDGVKLLKCTGQERDITVQWEIGFKLTD